MIIYKILNKLNGKTYIGLTTQSLNRRICQHLSSDKRPIGKAFKKYGIAAFEISVIDRANSREELNQKERQWIAFYGCKSPNGYNLTAGGDGMFEPSEETRKRMSIGQRGRKASIETRRKLSISLVKSHRENPRSDEVKRKIADAHRGDKSSSKRLDVRKKISDTLMGNIPWNKGKRLSEEHCRNLSESHKGYKQSIESKTKKSESLKLAYAEGRKRPIRLIGAKNPMNNPEFRAKATLAMRGLKRSDEHRDHLSESHKGKRLSPESEKKRIKTLLETLKARHPDWNFKKAVQQ